MDIRCRMFEERHHQDELSSSFCGEEGEFSRHPNTISFPSTDTDVLATVISLKNQWCRFHCFGDDVSCWWIRMVVRPDGVVQSELARVIGSRTSLKIEPGLAALASELAGEIYGLNVLARHIEDHGNNTTRFLVMAPKADLSRRGDDGMMTSFVFQVRNIPAALYKAMGGFATNGVNMTKLESYMVDGSFTATQFYADIEGHPDDPAVQRALEELEYFTSDITMLGVYPADPRRH